VWSLIPLLPVPFRPVPRISKSCVISPTSFRRFLFLHSCPVHPLFLHYIPASFIPALLQISASNLDPVLMYASLDLTAFDLRANYLHPVRHTAGCVEVRARAMGCTVHVLYPIQLLQAKSLRLMYLFRDCPSVTPPAHHFQWRCTPYCHAYIHSAAVGHVTHGYPR